MGDGLWSGGDTTPFTPIMEAMVSGVYHDGSDNVNKLYTSADVGTGGVRQLDDILQATSLTWGDNNNMRDFGILRAVGKAYSPTQVGGSNNNTNYVQGPFLELFQKLLAGSGSTIWGDAWDERDAFGGLSDLSSLNMSFGSNSEIAEEVKAFAEVLMDVTEFQSWRDDLTGDWTTWLSLLTDGLTLTAITAPAWSVEAFSWTAPTVATITAPTVATPTAVSVDDVIDDAVEAAQAIIEDNFTNDEADMRAGYFGTRRMQTGGFDVATALLASSKTKQKTEYDKQLRAEQAKMQAQADLAHQQNLVEVNTRNAQFTLDASKSNAENVLRLGQLVLEGAKSKSEVSLAAMSAKTNAVVQVGVAESEQYGNALRVRADVLGVLFDSAFKYVNTRSGTAAASLYTGIQDVKQRELAFQRQFHNQFLKDKMDYRNQLSGGLSASYEVAWRSMLQNLMLVKEAMSAIGATNAGTEHQPSGFEKTANVASLLTGLVSTGINLGMILT